MVLITAIGRGKLDRSQIIAKSENSEKNTNPEAKQKKKKKSQITLPLTQNDLIFKEHRG